MAAMKLRVGHILVTAVTTAFLVLPSLFLYQRPSVQHVHSMLLNLGNSLLPAHEHMTAREYQELQRVLSKAAMANKTVIITTLNKAWAAEGAMVDLFLQSFKRGHNIEHLLQHLVIVTLDATAHERCLQLHHFCFRLQTEGVDFAGEKKFMSDDYLRMMWRRIKFLGDVLDLGYSFVFSDADVVWFRDPFPKFTGDSDFQIACDKYRGAPFDVANNAPNGGFVFVRATPRTAALYRFWYAARLRIPGKHDQDVLSVILTEKDFSRLGVTIRFLDTLYFSGFCQMSTDMDQVVTLHANCCKGGLPNKLTDLQLALDDWQSHNNNNKIIAPPEYDKSGQSTGRSSRRAKSDHHRVMHWRVPLSCRRSKHWIWWRRTKNLL